MNDLDQYWTQNIIKKIYLKRKYLNLYAVNLDYLIFLESIENFELYIEGVQPFPISYPVVQLPNTRRSFKEVQRCYKLLKLKIQSKFEKLSTESKETLYQDFIRDYLESKVFIEVIYDELRREIQQQIKHIYNINFISNIEYHLEDLKYQTIKCKKNLRNLRRSCDTENILEVLTKIFNSINKTIDFHYNRILIRFPKITSRNSNIDKMPQREVKSAESSRSNVYNSFDDSQGSSTETDNNLRKKFLASNKKMRQKSVVEFKKRISNSEILSQTSSSSAEHTEINRKREKLQDAINDLKRLKNLLMNVNKQKNSKTKSFDDDCLALEEKKLNWEKSSEISKEQKFFKMRKLEELENVILEKYQKDIKILQFKSDEIEKLANIQIRTIDILKQELSESSFNVFESEVEEIADEIFKLCRNFKRTCNIKRMREVCSPASIISSSEGVSLFEEACSKESKSEKINVEHEEQKEVNKNDNDETEQLPQPDIDLDSLDDVEYIQQTLGRPLVQGLASIAVYQPKDPINYLGNFLLHYYSNEAHSKEKGDQLEKLLAERQKIEQSKQMNENPDPCGPCTSKGHTKRS